MIRLSTILVFATIFLQSTVSYRYPGYPMPPTFYNYQSRANEKFANEKNTLPLENAMETEKILQILQILGKATEELKTIPTKIMRFHTKAENFDKISNQIPLKTVRMWE